MNIEEFENEIEKILDKNHEQKMHWIKLFVKAHREGKRILQIFIGKKLNV